MKHKTFVSTELIMNKLLPQENNQANVSSISPSSIPLTVVISPFTVRLITNFHAPQFQVWKYPMPKKRLQSQSQIL